MNAFVVLQCAALLHAVRRDHLLNFASHARLQLDGRNDRAICPVLENVHDQFQIVAIWHLQLISTIGKKVPFLLRSSALTRC